MAFLRSICFLMALLTCHQLVAGTLQHAGLKGKPVLRVQAETGPLLSEKELLKDLTEHRNRRAAAGLPVTVSNFTFPSESHTSGIIQYSGGDSKVIFVLMYTLNSNGLPSSSILYRSTNYGQTFSRSSLNSEVGTQHILYQSIHVAPNNNKILVFRDTLHAQIYITKDEGATFITQQLTPNTVNPRSILFHPTLYTHFLIYDSTNNTLYFSTDLGQSLIKISDYVPSGQYQWGVAPFDLEPTVYYNVFNPADVNSGDYTVHLYRQVVPGNYAEEFDPSIGKHDDFLIVGRYMFIQKTSSSGLATLWVSYDRNPFRMAHIPSVIAHQNYIVDDIKSLQALVIVQHTNGQYNLYLSEETGQYFTLSLPDLVVANGGLDLELVDSINATYIANQNIGSDVRTLISFDNGGNWQLLKPPPSTLTCQAPSCSLHLHMSSSQYWRTGVYSQASAPGIIIAHGTTGSSLSSNPDLFVSTDGGINWIMSLQSTWGVTVLDHGGLIVAAKDYHQQDHSSVLMYSCNEGSTWTSYTFSNRDMTIFGVITEPGETTTSVSLFGIEHFANIEWEVVQINFTTVFTGLCQPADYFWWHPWDERSSSECLLGNRVSIQRRRPSVCCLNSQQFSRVVNYTKCACVFEDFECDYGYMHSDGVNGTCVRDASIALPGYCQDGVTHDTLSKGYRKVGGDVCKEGLESVYGATDTPCCSNGSTTCPPPTTCPSCPTPNTCPTCPPPTTCPSCPTPTTCPPPTSCPSCPTPTTCPTCPPPTTCPSCPNPANCPTCPPTTCQPCTNPTNCPNCPFTNIPTSCPPCSSSNTPTSYTHVTGSVAGPATSSTNVVAVVLAVLLVITVVIVVALFTVSVVLVWKLMGKSGYQAVPRNERFVFRQNSPDRVQTNLGFQADDDEAPLQP